MRRAAQLGWIYFLFLSGMLRFARWKLSRHNATVVLVLHRVLSEPEYSATSSPAGMVVRQRTFAALISYLQKSCEVVDAAEGWSDRPRKPGRVRVALTFDDGWNDTLTEAYKVTAERQIPITIFICPGLQGKTFPFWPEKVLKWWKQSSSLGGVTGVFTSQDSLLEYLKSLSETDRQAILDKAPPDIERDVLGEPCNSTLDWDQTRELSKRGVKFGSHTNTHPLLPRVSSAQVATELLDSRRAIVRQLGEPCSLFAYPNGDWNPEVREQVASAGYRFAFTTRPGAWTKDSDPFLIPRVNVYEKKLEGISGGFSRVAFGYSVLWKAARAL